MGKKSRHKKQKSQGGKPQLNQHNTPRVVQGIEPASLAGVGTAAVSASTPTYNKNVTVMDIQTEYVRSDITRILLMLVIVLLVLTSLYLLKQKTSYLDQAGAYVTGLLAG